MLGVEFSTFGIITIVRLNRLELLAGEQRAKVINILIVLHVRGVGRFPLEQRSHVVQPLFHGIRYPFLIVNKAHQYNVLDFIISKTYSCHPLYEKPKGPRPFIS